MVTFLTFQKHPSPTDLVHESPLMASRSRREQNHCNAGGTTENWLSGATLSTLPFPCHGLCGLCPCPCLRSCLRPRILAPPNSERCRKGSFVTLPSPFGISRSPPSATADRHSPFFYRILQAREVPSIRPVPFVEPCLQQRPIALGALRMRLLHLAAAEEPQQRHHHCCTPVQTSVLAEVHRAPVLVHI